jgi:hypothetical protein
MYDDAQPATPPATPAGQPGRTRSPGAERACPHPGAPHTHGQRATYVKDRCRCQSCTAANTAASAAASRRRVYGQPNPYIDATPTRDHIATLRQAGVSYHQIASLAHTSPTHVREIAGTARRSEGRPPIRRIRQNTADRIQAIQPHNCHGSPGSRVDATGTRRRLQALVASGWSRRLLGIELDRTIGTLNRVMSSDKVLLRTARQVMELYDRLWDMAPPSQTAEKRSSIAEAQAYANERGWHPPLAWDHIDADPRPPTPPVGHDLADLDEIAIERALAADGVRLEHLTFAEQIEAIRRLTAYGSSIRDIASQLDTTARTISRRRASHGATGTRTRASGGAPRD